MEAASIAHAHDDHEHHGPPPANRSSRVETQLLGMLLFIVSEVMVFGAFFTAYFFIRVVTGDQWFPFQGHKLPVAVAGVNTAILLSSSVTMHWAETSIKNGNRLGLKVNAGHGLNYDNVGQVAAIPGIAELNIGHAIVAQAVFAGWETAVREMKRLMTEARRA